MFVDDNPYGKILDNLYDGLYLADRKRKIVYWNKAAERITGFKAEDVVGKSCADNILTHIDENGASLCRGSCPLAMSIKSGETQEKEVFLHHRDGHRVPVSVRVTPWTDAEDRIIGGIELFSDISHAKAIEMRVKELEELALLDNLTKLANRRYIEQEICVRFEETKRMGTPFGILFIDIDDFKRVNDDYGHDRGDIVLKFVSDTLTGNSRPFDLVGRWGGEEFVVIARNLKEKHLEQMGNRLRIMVENSFVLMGKRKLHVTVSLGATLAKGSDSPESLFKRADDLLYESKKAGKNRVTIG